MLQSLLNTLFGCSHQRTTFPLTPGRTNGYSIPGDTPKGTYVVCLDCGKEFAYNWDQMRVGVTLPSNTADLAPVADGRFDGLPRHVS
jgi:hypothetical protein